MNTAIRFFHPKIVASHGRLLFSSSPATAATAAVGKDKIVVLGTGWAGFCVALNIRKDVPLTVVSPLNHFLFTPLLASSAVGTLEFRCIQEPIRTVLGQEGKFIQARATGLDPDKRKLTCLTAFNDTFELDYDKLVISVGVKTNVSST
jgi:NADH dehydrogenase FAD-containing subunit